MHHWLGPLPFLSVDYRSPSDNLRQDMRRTPIAGSLTPIYRSASSDIMLERDVFRHSP
jgi:hypothetical protein